mgnify:CR=1 FL=1
MKYLLILDAALFALAATMAVVLGVVLIMYSAHSELSARIGTEMPALATLIGCFAVLSMAWGLAFWSLLRERVWHWWAQAGAVTSLAIGSLYLYGQLAP